MKKVQGDLILLAQKGEFDLIIHGCNCFCTMGAGIAVAIKSIFPPAFYADLETTKGDKAKLGTISWAEIRLASKQLIVVNAYTQYHYYGEGTLVDYEAIRRAFRELKRRFSGLKMAYPAIGAGLGGGDWNIISQIINKELEGEDHTFVEYLPSI